MKNFSNDYLIKIFRTKLGNLESDPQSDSWDKIAGALPPQKSPIFFPSGKSILAIISAFLITGGGFLYQETLIPHTSLKNSAEAHHYIPEKGNELTVVDEQVNQPADTTQSEKTVKTNPLTSKAFNAEKNISNNLIKKKGFVQERKTNSQRLDEKHKQSMQESLVEKISLPHSANLYNKAESEIADEKQMNTESTDSTLIPSKELPIDSTRLTNNDEKEKTPKDQSIHWILKIMPFYNTSYFTPNTGDNSQLREISPSENIFKNRMGVSFGIGQTARLGKKIEVEYVLTYRFFSKNFDYQLIEVNGDQTIVLSTKKVAESIHTIGTNIGLRSSVLGFKYPIVVNLGYERLLSDGTKSIYSKHLLSTGLGIEWRAYLKVTVKPSVQYGIPVGHTSTYFSTRPVFWGVELIRRIN